ncbi:MAG: ATP-grasp domain-containing protein [Simkaniaceae bacterium]|nr:ATP-grasp domain-containing protein [Candidatus Sacchlamyda saccharinae]
MDAIIIVDPVFSVAKLKTAARDLGYEVICVFFLRLEKCESIWGTDKQKLLTDCTTTIVSDDLEEILREIEALQLTVKGSVAGHESGVELADQIAEKLNLFHNDIKLSTARRDKGEMRRVLKESNLTCPDFTTCTSLQQVMDFAGTHRFPLMMKTPKGAGTSQVFECSNRDHLTKHFREILSEKNLYGLSAKEVVLEEYIPGTEYIVNTFSDGVDVHVTDCWVYEKFSTAEHKNLYYNSITIPIDAPEMQGMIEYALKVAKVFGLTRGVAHLEIKDDPEKGPTLIEIGARLPGVRKPDLIEKFSNFKPFQSQIKVFLHEKVEIPKPVVFTKHCGVAYCTCLDHGRLKKINGIEEIKKLPSYVDHMLNLKEGQTLSTSTQVTLIPLIVLLAHENRDQLLEDLENAHSLFQIELE